jgi:two-component system LytT family sensor kinase
MLLKRSYYWTCQIGGWLSYALTILFFSYVLQRELNALFIQRIFIGVSLGVLVSHLLRKSIIQLKLRPPTLANQWWKTVILIIVFTGLYSFLNSALVELFKLYDFKRETGGEANTPFIFSWNHIFASWNAERVGKRFLFSIFLDTPIFLVWMSVYVLWHYIEFANAEALKKVKLESLIKELELKTIKSQINPHFIFNALNSIRALVDEDPERARKAITELSNILRSSIQVDKVEITSLTKELAIVKDYLALEYIRFADRLKVEYEVDNAVIHFAIPPMMLQTLVENAIKHGLSKQPGDCLIKIIAKIESGKMVIMVQNTGKLQATENDGFGLQSTRDRLNILYSGEAEFEIYQYQPNLVTAKLTIPVQH